MDNLPMNQNINWVTAAAAVSGLIAYFAPGIPESVRQDILYLLFVAYLLLVPVLHTLINHPANQAKAMAMVNQAVAMADKVAAKAKKKSGALVIFAMIGLGFLGGCSVVGPYFSNPQNDLNLADAGVASIEALYVTACNSGALGQGVCSVDDLAKAAQLEKAITDAIATAQTLINIYDGLQPAAGTQATMPSLAQIEKAISQVTASVGDFANFVDSLQTKKAKAMAAHAAKVSLIYRAEHFAARIFGI